MFSSARLQARRANLSILDRLHDDAPGDRQETTPRRSVDEETARSLLRRDLSWLFNTRTSLDRDAYETRKLTILEYGIPDFNASFAANPHDRSRMEYLLRRAVEAYEPRLENPVVQVLPAEDDDKRLRVLIDGDMRMENMLIPVSFHTILDEDRRKWRMQVVG